MLDCALQLPCAWSCQHPPERVSGRADNTSAHPKLSSWLAHSLPADPAGSRMRHCARSAQDAPEASVFIGDEEMSLCKSQLLQQVFDDLACTHWPWLALVRPHPARAPFAAHARTRRASSAAANVCRAALGACAPAAGSAAARRPCSARERALAATLWTAAPPPGQV